MPRRPGRSFHPDTINNASEEILFAPSEVFRETQVLARSSLFLYPEGQFNTSPYCLWVFAEKEMEDFDALIS